MLKKDLLPFMRIGLAGRLTTMVILITLIVYIPTIIFGAFTNLNRTKENLEQYENALEIRLQSVFEPAIWNYDKETLTKLITTELGNKNVKSIHISSLEDNIIWLESVNGDVIATKNPPVGKFIEMHIIPIYKFEDNNQIIAYATVWYDRSVSRDQFYKSLQDEIIKTGLIILLIAAALTFSSYLKLVKPLESIRKSMIEAGRSSHDLAREKIEGTSFNKAFPEIKSMAEDLEHMFQDIDAAQQQTKNSEAQLRAIFQQAGVGVALVTAETARYIIVNQRYCDIVGYPMSEMLEMHFEQITHPDDIPLQYELIQKLQSGNIPEISLQKRYIRKDGNEVWAEMTVSPLWAPNEKPTNQIVVIQDITARKKAEAEIKKLNDELEAKVVERTTELEKANNQLETTLENLKSAQYQLVTQEKMAVLGQLVSGIAHEINTPLGIITSAGGTLERIINQEILDVIHFCATVDAETRNSYNRLVSIGIEPSGYQELTEKRTTRKRFYRIAEERGTTVPDEVMEKLVDIGYHADDDEFLVFITNGANWEAVKMAYSIVTMHKTTRMIRTSADKASKVISALKTYSHQDPSQQVTPSDVIKDIEVVLTLYYNQTKYGIEIEKNYEDVPPVLCYPDKLHQVWVNIINNALQAMNYKGRLKIDINKIDDKVKVSITDNGPGIPESIKDRIFEPFFTTKKQGEGTGLGLDIAKRIIEEIGGQIEVDSQPGATTFTVWLRT